MADQDIDTNLGMSRRTLIKRGAILGGLVWAAPSITSVASASAAQRVPGSPRCAIHTTGTNTSGQCVLFWSQAVDPRWCACTADPAKSFFQCLAFLIAVGPKITYTPPIVVSAGACP